MMTASNHKHMTDCIHKNCRDELLMKGTKLGSVIKPSDTFTSAMIMLMEGRADPSIRMPHGKEPIGKGEIDTLGRQE